jgi:hypothetical protein
MVMAVAVITMLLGAVEEDKRKAAAVIRNMRGMLVCLLSFSSLIPRGLAPSIHDCCCRCCGCYEPTMAMAMAIVMGATTTTTKWWSQ